VGVTTGSSGASMCAGMINFIGANTFPSCRHAWSLDPFPDREEDPRSGLLGPGTRSNTGTIVEMKTRNHLLSQIQLEDPTRFAKPDGTSQEGSRTARPGPEGANRT